MIKENDGRNYINEINTDGSIGGTVHGQRWSSGWSTAEFFQSLKENQNEWSQNYLFILKKSTGDVHIHKVF